MWRRALLKINIFAFLALIALTPFFIGYLWREPLAISYLNLASGAVIILTAANLLLGSLRLEPIRSHSLTLAIVLFAAMLLWGSVLSEPLRSILGPWTSRFLQPLLVGYSGYLLLRGDLLSYQVLARALYLSLLFLAGLGLLQLNGVISANNERITGLYLFPNSFARYLEILLLVLLPVWLVAADRLRKWFFLIWLLGLITLLATQSYAGVGSFVLGLMALVAFLPTRFKPLKLAVIVIITLGLSAAIAWRASLPKYQETVTSSLATRQQFWHIGWQTIKAQPLTGIGLEGWERRYLELARTYIDERQEKIIETDSAQPHNIFLDGWLRGGIIGLIAVSYLLLWPIVYSWRLIKDAYTASKSAPWLAYGALGYGVAMLTFGLVDDPIFSDDAMTILFVLFFALASSRYEPPLVRHSRTS